MVKYCCQMLLVLAILGAATSALTGCGQKGPLYLPGNPSEIKTVVPPEGQTEAPEDEEDEEEPEEE